MEQIIAIDKYEKFLTHIKKKHGRNLTLVNIKRVNYILLPSKMFELRSPRLLC